MHSIRIYRDSKTSRGEECISLCLQECIPTAKTSRRELKLNKSTPKLRDFGISESWNRGIYESMRTLESWNLGIYESWNLLLWIDAGWMHQCINAAIADSYIHSVFCNEGNSWMVQHIAHNDRCVGSSPACPNSMKYDSNEERNGKVLKLFVGISV